MLKLLRNHMQTVIFLVLLSGTVATTNFLYNNKLNNYKEEMEVAFENYKTELNSMYEEQNISTEMIVESAVASNVSGSLESNEINSTSSTSSDTIIYKNNTPYSKILNYYFTNNNQTITNVYTTEESKNCSHKFVKSVVRELTCNQTSIDKYTCSTCGIEYTVESNSVGNHKWKYNYNDSNKTICEYVNSTCEYCNQECKHEFVKKDYQSSLYCKTCGIIENATEGHNYQLSSWTYLTCLIDGTNTYTCTKCGKKYTETITVATGHNFVDNRCTKCGYVDSSKVNTENQTSTLLSVSDNVTVNSNFTISLNLPTEVYAAEANITISYCDGTTDSEKFVYVKGMSDYPNPATYKAKVSGMATITVSNIVCCNANSDVIDLEQTSDSITIYILSTDNYTDSQIDEWRKTQGQTTSTTEEETSHTHTHSYTTVVSQTSATCTTSGSIVKQCSCGDTITETTPATGHTYNGSATCTVCGAANPNYTKPSSTENTTDSSLTGYGNVITNSVSIDETNSSGN